MGLRAVSPLVSGSASVSSLQVTGLTPGQVVYPDATSTLKTSPGFTYDDAINLATGTETVVGIQPTISQSGNAGYTVLDINVTESSVGSGTKLLQRWVVGGTTLASINNIGTSYFNSLATNSATRTASFTLGAVNQGSQFCDATSGAIVATLPTAAFGGGRIFIIKKIDASANTVTIQGNGAETIDGTNTRVLSTQYSSLIIQSNGTAWFILADR